MYRNHVGRGRDVDDGGEISQWVVRDFWVDGRVGRRGGHRRHAQRVAIWRGFCDLVGANHAAAAGLVLHHDHLAHGLAHGVGNGAGNDVSGAAWCKRHLQLDDFVGVALGKRVCGCGEEAEGEKRGAMHGGGAPEMRIKYSHSC